MVVKIHFDDLIDESTKASAISLPSYKDVGLKIQYENVDEVQTVYKDKPPLLPFAQTHVFNASICSWRRLVTCEASKAVYEVTLNTKDSNFKFRAGDTIGILPRNVPSDVDAILNHLGITAQADLAYTLNVDNSIKGAKVPLHIPIKSCLRHTLTNCVDLRGVLKKLFLLALSRHTKCDVERKVLEYLSSKEGSAAYTNHILNENISILEIFNIFKTCKPPIEVILANLPRLLPRPYSVVNSGLIDSHILKICFSILELPKNRKGITTGWIEDLILNDLEYQMENLSIRDENSCRIPIYIRQNLNKFCLPENMETPLLLIATGTGIAPFIGFLEERAKRQEEGIKLGQAWLLFGCRNPKQDFIYEAELNDFKSKKVLSNITTAFSRVEKYGAKYVQDALLQNGEEINKFIENGASIFVCGEAKTMVAEVKDNFIKCLVEYGGKTKEEAENIISQLQQEKRYIVDLWS